MSQDMLRARFQSVTGRELPEPGDPGRAEWWGDSATPTAVEAPVGESAMRIVQARTLLALTPGADLSELEKKYEELKSIFESEMVSAMGPAALQVAAHRIERIEKAYRVMRAELAGGAV
jgi:hypothetical protein